MVNQFGTLFLLLALAWIGQLALSLLQTRTFYRRVARLRKGSYASAIGVTGSNWKRKVYGVLVVDENLTITAAERLRGFTVFAGLKPQPELVGHPLDRVEQELPLEGMSKKTWSAFQNAAGYIRSHEQHVDDEIADSSSDDEDAVPPVALAVGKEECGRA